MSDGEPVAALDHVTVAYGSSVALRDVSASFASGAIGLLGPNGSGKSVLFRLLLGLEEADEGETWVGPSIRLGYYSQQHETLDLAKTPIEIIRDLRPMHENEAVGLLGRFLFSYRQAQEPCATLSGGEKSRLQLARLMLSGVNCLLLDEPTNHLDIASTEVLEAALNQFDGTLLTISHDRYFLDRTCTRILELDEGEIMEYQGSYSDYAEQKQRRMAG